MRSRRSAVLVTLATLMVGAGLPAERTDRGVVRRAVTTTDPGIEFDLPLLLEQRYRTFDLRVLVRDVHKRRLAMTMRVSVEAVY